MAAVDEKVKQIIVEQLQVDEAESRRAPASRKTSARIRSTSSSWSWQFEEAFDIQIPTKTPRRSRRSKDAPNYSRSIRNPSKQDPKRGPRAGESTSSYERARGITPGCRSSVASSLQASGLLCGVGNTREEVWPNLLAGTSDGGRSRPTAWKATRCASLPR